MRPSAAAVVLLAGSLSCAACSSPKPPEKSDAADDATAALTDPIEAAADAPAKGSDADLLRVSHNTDSIIIDNEIGRRLISVRVELTVAESELPYILIVPTIEKDSKATFQMMMFRTESADVLVDPTSVHPKSVTIKAHDSFGRPHEVTVPWSDNQ